MHFIYKWNGQGPIWAAHDAPNGSGATELHYVEGLYTLWDELLAAHPGLMIVRTKLDQLASC